MAVDIHTVQSQIENLENLGLTIEDKRKAEEILSDIGYYRLGFYCFPFEQNFPAKQNRNHLFRSGTTFDTVVRLYYFDFDLRHLLMKYISRIEVHLKTTIVNTMAKWHKNSDTWFVNDRIVSPGYTNSFDKVYDQVKLSPYIISHHHKHDCKYAPAHKTIEFMTLGNKIDLISAINDVNIRLEIANEFGIRSLKTFESYLLAVKRIRNRCAHAGVLFDYSTAFPILEKGPVNLSYIYDRTNLNGAVKVISYLVGQVSNNRKLDLSSELRGLIESTKDNHNLYTAISICSGLK